MTNILAHNTCWAPQSVIQSLIGQTPMLINDLAEWVSIPSVTSAEIDMSANGAPFGPTLSKALDTALDTARRLGFQRVVSDPEGFYGFAEIGNQNAAVRVLMPVHLDVVHPGNEASWIAKDPWKLVIDDEKIYGRGTSDNKGPGLIALYSAAHLLGFSLRPDTLVRVAFFLQEEVALAGADVKKYLNDRGGSTITIVPDGWFPGSQEQARMEFSIAGNGNELQSNGSVKLMSITTGENSFNRVPDEVIAKFESPQKNYLEALLDLMVSNMNGEKDTGISAEINRVSRGFEMTVKVTGKAAHAARAWQGKNAIYVLSHALERAQLKDSLSLRFLKFVRDGLRYGVRGEVFGLDGGDPEQVGKQSVNLGIVHINGDKIDKIVIDTRVRMDVDVKKFEDSMAKLATQFGFDSNVQCYEPALAIDSDSKYAVILREAYSRHTGIPAPHFKVSGGRSYATDFASASSALSIAFGEAHYEQPSTAHEVNEYITFARIAKGLAIYFDVLWRIVVDKDS